MVRVRYESNYTEVAKNGSEQSYYAVEEWALSRARGVQSRTPDRARIFACPSCGAPLDAVTAGTCAHCGKLASSGQFDWVVREIRLVSRTPRGPMLTGDTPEAGTDLPTIVDPQAGNAIGRSSRQDPALTWQAFQARVALIFGEFQIAWSARDLTRMRAYLSDRLFETQAFWVEAYKKQGLRNVTENARILQLELARVDRDRFFDAITLRVWATSLDYTLADDRRPRRRRKPLSGAPLHGVLDAHSEQRPEGARPHRPRLPELRSAARHQHGGRLQLLQSQGDRGPVRLGAQPDRAGRSLRGVVPRAGPPGGFGRAMAPP